MWRRVLIVMVFMVHNVCGMYKYVLPEQIPLVRDDIVLDIDPDVPDTLFHKQMVLLDLSYEDQVLGQIGMQAAALTSFILHEPKEDTARVWSAYHGSNYIGVAGLRYIHDRQASLQWYLKKSISDQQFITLLDLIIVHALDTMKLKLVNICVERRKKRLTNILTECATKYHWKKNDAKVWGQKVWYGISLSDE